MSNVYIATIFDNTNTGTYLQAIALATKISKTGNKPIIINYCRPHERWYNKLWESLKRQHKPLYRRLLTPANILLYTILRHRLKRFVRNYCSIKRLSEVSNDIASTDILMTGSDQVWNNLYNRGIDNIYYLQFINTQNKRVAYAASIGQEQLIAKEKKRIREVLQRYHTITVRESHAVNLLKEIGIEATQVLDPTLLLDRNEWLDTISRSKFKKKEPYLLIYSVEWDKNVEVSDIAKQIATENGLKIYGFSTDRKLSSFQCDKFFSFGLPSLFIDLFNQADFVIISSFHGTAFSINFNKQFIAILPEKFSSRSYSLLNQLGLSDRIYDGTTPIWRSTIDYTKVNNKLSENRARSMSLLRKLVTESPNI